MSNHLRHCPKHKKPLPCAHCALAAKPAQVPAVAVMELEPEPEILPEPPKSAVTQAQEIVLSLMEDVAGVEGTSYRDTDKNVKQLVRDAFSSPAPIEHKPDDLELPLSGEEELPELPTPEGGFDSYYNPEVYRTEISKALASGRSRLLGQEGRKDFEDLEQIVAIEIWKATKHYRDKMNEKLAYRIAKNQADKFLKASAEQPTFLSVADKPENIEGVEQEESYAESLLNKRNQEGIRPGTWDPFSLEKVPETADWLQALHEHGVIDQLKQLVKQWHGTKRMVAEAILKRPDLTAREIPGVPKSTAARVPKAVLAEFEKLIRGSHSLDNKADRNDDGTK